jgi:sulfate adenylyltransferase subunit 1 (EFTu-like GTPase family)
VAMVKRVIVADKDKAGVDKDKAVIEDKAVIDKDIDINRGGIIAAVAENYLDYIVIALIISLLV